MKKETTIKKVQGLFDRRLQISGLKVHEIYFYDSNGVWFINKSGWLDGIGGDSTAIHEGELKRRIKENFKDTAPYYLVSNNRNHYDKGYNLYIYAPKVEPIEFVWQDNDRETDYGLSYKNVAVCYSVEDKDYNSITLEQYCTRTVVKPFGKKCLAIAEVISKACHSSVSEYDVESMLEVLNISIKKGEQAK